MPDRFVLRPNCAEHRPLWLLDDLRPDCPGVDQIQVAVFEPGEEPDRGVVDVLNRHAPAGNDYRTVDGILRRHRQAQEALA